MRCGSAASSSRRSRDADQLELDLGLPPAVPSAAPRPSEPPAAPSPAETRPTLVDGPAGLDLDEAMRGLVADIRARVAPLGHVDPERIVFAVSYARSRRRHGIYAYIVPLRFAGGEATVEHEGKLWSAPRLEVNGREPLYVIYLMAPRFFNLDPAKKLETVIHELYHVGELCDGDLRRFGVRAWAHGASRKRYDEMVCLLTRTYLDDSHGSRWPPAARFLRWNIRQLEQRFGGVFVPRIPRPRVRRVTGDAGMREGDTR